MTNTYRHKDVWSLPSNALFAIEVTRHAVQTQYVEIGQGANRWAVYAYIYPSHPLFAEFEVDTELLYQPATENLPLHGGCTFVRKFFDGVSPHPRSIKVGADYNHLYDEAFSHMITKEEATAVFADADRLFSFLRDYAAPAAAPLVLRGGSSDLPAKRIVDWD